jgi:hypothetical protein
MTQQHEARERGKGGAARLADDAARSSRSRPHIAVLASTRRLGTFAGRAEEDDAAAKAVCELIGPHAGRAAW